MAEEMQPDCIYRSPVGRDREWIIKRTCIQLHTIFGIVPSVKVFAFTRLMIPRSPHNDTHTHMIHTTTTHKWKHTKQFAGWMIH